jgi:hypothetical protein
MKNPAEQLRADGSVDTVRQHPFLKGINWQVQEDNRVKPPDKEKVGVCSVCLVVFLIYMEII